jgi:hypothetical protein
VKPVEARSTLIETIETSVVCRIRDAPAIPTATVPAAP